MTIETKSKTGWYGYRYTTRYCETCKTVKPRNTQPVKKGWKCDDCLEKIRNVRSN